MFDNYINQILTLVEEAGTIEGRKKFQKIAFIIQSKGVDLQERFKYHYYGPFSSDLQLEIDDLVDEKYLIEECSDNFYSYRIAPKILFEKDKDIVNRKDLINLLNEKDTKILELTSTIYFLNREGYSDKEIIEKKLEILKPHLSKYIPQAFQLREEIDEMCENYI